MAVRVTAGRIWVTATLAVLMAVVSYGVDPERPYDGSQLQGNTTFHNCYMCQSGQCVASPPITINNWHTGDSNPPPTCEEMGAISAWQDINNNGGIDPGETCPDKCALVSSSSSAAPTTCYGCGNCFNPVQVSAPSTCADAGMYATTPACVTACASSSASPASSAASSTSSTSSTTSLSSTSHPPSTSSSTSFSYSSSSSSTSSSSSSHPSSVSSTSTSASSTTTSSSTPSTSSSSSSGYCGDGIVAPADFGPDGLEGTPDDIVTEQCDGGPDCTAECTFNGVEPPDNCDPAVEICVVVPRCGDGITQADLGEQCDDADGNNLNSCNNACQNVVAPPCGNGRADPGEACDDGNQNDADSCNNACVPNVGGQCDQHACDGGGAPVCGQNEQCQLIAQLPCIQCVPNVGGQCLGNECVNGGDAAAAAQNMDCSLIPNLPCVQFIPRNSCGNGEINLVNQAEADEGCEITGTSGQYCVSEGVVPEDFGVYLPSNQCFLTAHCENTNGACGWEQTPELQECLDTAQDGTDRWLEGVQGGGQQGGQPGQCTGYRDFRGDVTQTQPRGACAGGMWVPDSAGVCNCVMVSLPGTSPTAPVANVLQGSALVAQAGVGGNGQPLPAGCVCNGPVLNDACPVFFVVNPCVPLGGQGCNNPVACPSDIKWCCDQDGNHVSWVSRDGCNQCAWEQCSSGSTEACGNAPANTCVRGGCFGEMCVPANQTPPVVCSFSQDAACYDNAICEWTGTNCSWRDTPELEECLNDNADGTCPSDQSCLTPSACDQSGGSGGAACGADNTSVCCSGGEGQPDEPVEQCDDGNQVDNDACGNDCEINCRRNSDCPEGACVEGQCVDQCVADDGGGNNGGASSSGNVGSSGSSAASMPASGCRTPYPLCWESDPIGGAAADTCPSGQTVQWDPAPNVMGCGQTHTGRCYTCKPDQQASAGWGDFLSRLMAQQVSSGFRLLP